MFGAVRFLLNVLILQFCVSNLFNSVKITELPPVWERAANSAYHLIFKFYFVKIYLSIFPFDVWDKLWLLIRPVPEVSSLI